MTLDFALFSSGLAGKGWVEMVEEITDGSSSSTLSEAIESS